MRQLAEMLFNLAKIEKDPVIKLSALLDCVENLASDSSYDYSVLEDIKKDDMLYKIYSEIIDQMFNLVLYGEAEVDEIIAHLEEYLNKVERGQSNGLGRNSLPNGRQA